MIIRRFLTAAAAALMLTESALALSCVQPDLARTMEAAKASDDLYYIFVGTFETPPQPKQDNSLDALASVKPRADRFVPARFDGVGLSQIPQYDSQLSAMPMEIKLTCAGPWCAAVPAAGKPVIAFVKARQGQTPLLEIGPCPNYVFPLAAAPTAPSQAGPYREPKQLTRLRQCFDKSCKPKDNVHGDYY
jgi:hypothetical protein